MPRVARKKSQSGFYHVIVQGINKEYILKQRNTLKNIEKLFYKNLKMVKQKY